MKTRFLSLLICIILAIVALSGSAFAADIIDGGSCGENVTWTLDKNGLLTISGEGDMWDYQENEAPWIDNRERVFSVVIENGVTSVGDFTFCKMFLVSDVQIADTVISIGQHAFFGCDGMTSVKIPAHVTVIGWRAFVGCKSLEAIWVDEDNHFYSNDENGVLFNEDKTELIRIPDTVSGEYHIPESVTTINFNAIELNDHLTTIYVPSSVNKIKGFTFSACDDLESVVFEGDAPVFEEYAFINAEMTVYYPVNNPTWTEDIMQNYDGEIEWRIYDLENPDLLDGGACGENLTWTFNVDGTLTISGEGEMYTYSSSVDIPWSEYKDKLTCVIIDEGVASICAHAFAAESNIINVTIPKTVRYIGENAFFGCRDTLELRFEDTAPEFEGDSWFADGMTIYYPRLDPSWKAVRDICVDDVNWKPYTVEKAFSYVLMAVAGIMVLGIVSVIVYKWDLKTKSKEQ